MKLRIKGNSIRLRLSQSEVKSFHETGNVVEHTSFPAGQPFSYSLRTSHTESFSVEHLSHGIEISVPGSQAKTWCEGEEVGMEAFLPLDDGDQLRVLIEKDFACLTVREHEDESDNFPNPNLTC